MSQQQQQQGGQEGSLDILWMMVLLVFGVAIIWYFGKPYIAAAVFFIRDIEISVINFVLTGWNKFAAVVGLPVHNGHDLMEMRNYMHTIESSKVTFDEVNQLSSMVGSYLRYPIMLVMFVLAVYVYNKHITLKFKYIFDMKRLRKFEQHNWPTIMPVSKLDLVNEDINKGPWAMALTPMQFAKKNDLLITDTIGEDGTVKVKSGAAQRFFAMQLGPTVGEIERLPIHVQALFAIFAARGNRDREAADNLLKQLAISSGTGKLDFTGVKELVAKHKDTKYVRLTMQRHAYVLTMLASLLEFGRTDGVLASAEFLWLKPVDRRLWYMMNTVGRQTPFVEVAGPYAHWLAEKEMGRGMRTPMVEQATKALELAMEEIIYNPEEV